MKKIFLILSLIAFTFSGCEKDDICDGGTPTTPRLVIEFYDINTTLPRNVINLIVTSPGITEPVPLSETSEGAPVYISNANKIAVPLKILEDKTKLVFVLNSENETLKSSDTIDFSYTRTSSYVSRACGFKTTFTLVPPALDPIVINEDPALNSGNWMENIEIVKSNIESENEVHLKIFF